MGGGGRWIQMDLMDPDPEAGSLEEESWGLTDLLQPRLVSLFMLSSHWFLPTRPSGTWNGVLAPAEPMTDWRVKLFPLIHPGQEVKVTWDSFVPPVQINATSKRDASPPAAPARPASSHELRGSIVSAGPGPARPHRSRPTDRTAELCSQRLLLVRSCSQKPLLCSPCQRSKVVQQTQLLSVVTRSQSVRSLSEIL